MTPEYNQLAKLNKNYINYAYFSSKLNNRVAQSLRGATFIVTVSKRFGKQTCIKSREAENHICTFNIKD